MWVPEERCVYCSKKNQKTEEQKARNSENICSDCLKWLGIMGNSSPKPEVEEKPSPMAADSRGLHEKYFQDG